jgi:hypothetical protein
MVPLLIISAELIKSGELAGGVGRRASVYRGSEVKAMRRNAVKLGTKK